MKKLIIIGVLVVVIGVGAFISITLLKRAPVKKEIVIEKAGEVTEVIQLKTLPASEKGKFHIENCIPQDSIIYVSIRDVKETWGILKNSQFWKQLTALKIWTQADLGTNLSFLQEQFKKNFGFVFGEEDLLGLLGQNVSFAVFSKEGTPISPQLLFFAEIDSRSNAYGKFSLMLDKAKENMTAESKIYKEVEVTTLKNPALPGPQFNYTFLGDIFVLGVGLDDTAIRTAIDLALGNDSKMMKNDKRYQQSVKRLGMKGDIKGELFINIEKIVELIKSFPIPTEAEGVNIIQGIENTLGVVSSIFGAVSFQEGILFKLFFLKNQTGTNKELLDSWNTKPQECKSLTLIPENALLLTVSNSINISQLWSAWKKSTENQTIELSQTILSNIADFEANVGISLEKDLLPVIADEIAFVLSDVSLGGLFPFPQLLLIIKTNDVNKAEAVITKLIDFAIEKSTPQGVSQETTEGGTAPVSLMTKASEEYQGTAITSLDIKLPFLTLTPSFFFHKDFLIISSNKASAQKVIEVTLGSARMISKDVLYKKVTADFSEKLNQLGYINTKRVLGIAAEIIQWAMNLQGLGAQPAGGTGTENTKNMLQENVVPLLNCFQALRGIGIEAINHDDGFLETILLNIEDI
ncbi:hypothetical protein ACFL1T_04000 [Chlamydiota bacterium]